MILPTPPDLPFLSPNFGPHMVLQREKPNAFWGWTTPGETVTVSIEGQKASNKAGPDGRWTVRLTPPKVGGPYRVSIDGPQHVALDDVLVGDVWLCTGQSNMEFGLTMANGGAAEAAEAATADRSQMRLFQVARGVGYTPRAVAGGEWKVCTPKTVAEGGWNGFSAVGYFFGKRLQDTLKVPIGLVEDCWGGTSAEAWTSARGLAPLGDFAPQLAMLPLPFSTESIDRNLPVYGTYADHWLDAHDEGRRGNVWMRESSPPPDYVSRPGWQNVGNGDWTPIQLPGDFAGATRGVVWLKKTVHLPDDVTDGVGTLSLGRISETDTTYTGGDLLGTTSFDWATRRYPVRIQRGTAFSITVRVFNPRAAGVFLSKPEELYLELPDGRRISLTGEWKKKVGFDMASTAERPRDMEPNPTVPTVLYNGMIAPVAPLAIKGAIWYQGETNSGRGAQYARLLPAMIADWRRAFGQGDFPFYIVSLANFMPRDPQPGDDTWAELREAQAHTAMTVPNSGLAVAIDVGQADDVHPKDKRTVGERLAAVALAKTYGQKVESSGPIYRSMKIEGDAIRLSFDHVQGFRTGKPGVQYVRTPDPVGFAVAGEDRKWHWATARDAGKGVLVVRSAEVPRPVAVRYAWGHNPDVNLYNEAWLPMVPFRTDDWPLLSRDAK